MTLKEKMQLVLFSNETAARLNSAYRIALL
jgi:hypothetical protein